MPALLPVVGFCFFSSVPFILGEVGYVREKKEAVNSQMQRTSQLPSAFRSYDSQGFMGLKILPGSQRGKP